MIVAVDYDVAQELARCAGVPSVFHMPQTVNASVRFLASAPTCDQYRPAATVDRPHARRRARVPGSLPTSQAGSAALVFGSCSNGLSARYGAVMHGAQMGRATCHPRAHGPGAVRTRRWVRPTRACSASRRGTLMQHGALVCDPPSRASRCRLREPGLARSAPCVTEAPRAVPG
jgi:hypothetical protein